MASDPEAKANGAITSAVARLLEAERKADEIVARAREQAEEVISAAKHRAQELKETERSAMVTDTTASHSGTDLDRQRRRIIDDGEERIEAMRAAATARRDDAVEKSLSHLIGES